jgi:hypothetical protein
VIHTDLTMVSKGLRLNIRSPALNAFVVNNHLPSVIEESPIDTFSASLIILVGMFDELDNTVFMQIGCEAHALSAV